MSLWKKREKYENAQPWTGYFAIKCSFPRPAANCSETNKTPRLELGPRLAALAADSVNSLCALPRPARPATEAREGGLGAALDQPAG